VDGIADLRARPVIPEAGKREPDVEKAVAAKRSPPAVPKRVKADRGLDLEPRQRVGARRETT